MHFERGYIMIKAIRSNTCINYGCFTYKLIDDFDRSSIDSIIVTGFLSYSDSAMSFNINYYNSSFSNSEDNWLAELDFEVVIYSEDSSITAYSKRISFIQWLMNYPKEKYS